MIAEKRKQRSRDPVIKTLINKKLINIKEFENKALNIHLSGLSTVRSSDYSLSHLL